MKYLVLLTALIGSLFTYSQNIIVDSQNYTPQELIENVLIDSDCIDNINVTNVIGGDFGSTDKSYGYFEANGSSFPFESGIVMSTGRLSNVPGPNTSLSDDDAPNWGGDIDLENALNESGTVNATIIEFEFTSAASQVSFRYLFASEEYQENDPNSCNYSDLFGFLIKPVGAQNQFENIALVPDTDTPVKATTVTPGVPGVCPPQNETYFGGYNGSDAPINFNGQTAILTATANITPNQTYHVKLVIADEKNYRYDSAVFLEAGSFELSTDLGPNMLIATSNALCHGETLEISAVQDGQSAYKWYKDGNLILSEPSNCTDCETYTITEPGTYTIEVTLENNCISYGEVIVEYAPLPVVNDSVLVECDINQDGLTTYNLFNATFDLVNGDQDLSIEGFFLTEADAIANENPITTPEAFQNTYPNQIVYTRIKNQANCSSIAELELQISNNVLNIPDLNGCDGDMVDGFANFDLSLIEGSILNQIPEGANVSYYETEEDAFNETNPLSNSFENSIANEQTIYVKVTSNNQCFSVTSVDLKVLYTPLLEADETVSYCLNTFPEPLKIYGGVLNDLPNNYYYEWQFNGTTTDVTTLFYNVTEPGIYTVIVTDPNGCSASRTITVESSNLAILESVDVIGVDPNNSVSINVSGEGDYEYALDDYNGPYQDSNVFTNVRRGFHTVYIKDKNGCGIVEETISVLGFPKYFTPNGDNQNDTWRVIGTNAQFNQIEVVQIYSRFGKLITQQTTLSGGWDGTLNGRQLPSDDYWFVAKFTDGKTYTGHFALRR
ncbi:gliding motility-associated-like protein [Winogradskyella epiphytica]|uniref:Gliding motility-associated-like protein n=1 Tax=Winogradskyella epiphytica TaxID=262005 RepID=A0A2V4XYQ8_9FLAO|nr:choice-of-anchor L domain-containing protein [Winogradskyella epiphytica]PYE80998.1 gliding motility-associated-like protein [Winogradskyella epiphytica]GGW66095.1 T9SS C-terminal target domain-containing protein [Winogradskyella epiphytica]